MGSTRGKFNSPEVYKFAFWGVGFIFLFSMPKLVFFLFALINDVVVVCIRFKRKTEKESLRGKPIERKDFITKIGLIAAGIPFLSLSYGMLKGRFNFRVIHQRVSIKNLPEALEGLRILQISDFHLGSFFRNYEEVAKGFKLINSQKVDLIVFTGDLVNNFASEVNGYEAMLNSLNAPLGKFAILGNHDYGDYSVWDNQQMKKDNFNGILNAFASNGFKLLRNENLQLEQNGVKFSLIGVENWGKPPFKRYGDLNKALYGVSEGDFKILLSHDPTHWDAEVLTKTSVDLTLAGHTHGMQLGIEIGPIKWSPAQFKYKRWAGLYQEGNQLLYVNRGFGYIGFPGRVGIPPEITVLELEKA